MLHLTMQACNFAEEVHLHYEIFKATFLWGAVKECIEGDQGNDSSEPANEFVLILTTVSLPCKFDDCCRNPRGPGITRRHLLVPS